MTTSTVIAVTSGAFAVIVACFTIWATAPLRRLEFGDLNDQLGECLRDRRALRQRLELLQHALIGLLPPDQRDALLLKLDDGTPPYDVPEAA